MTNRSSKGRSGPHSPKQGRGAPARPTRSQIQAMEARAASAEAGVEPAAPVVAPVALDFAAVESEVSRPSAGALPARARKRTVQKVVPITREQEYAYIRSDMQRLLTISGGLLVLMIALLFVIEL